MNAATIEVELLGVARLLARRATVDIPAAGPIALSELLAGLAGAAPALRGVVLSETGALLAGHVLTRDGVEWLRDPAERVAPGDRLLLLSTSAGG